MPRAYLNNISRCDKLNMSIHVVLRQQNDFDGKDSWCESTLTIRGTELERAKRRLVKEDVVEDVFWPRVAL